MWYMCISAPALNTKLSHLICNLTNNLSMTLCIKRFIASRNIIRAGKTTYRMNIKLLWDELSQWKTYARSAKLELATVDCDDWWQAICSRIFLLEEISLDNGCTLSKSAIVDLEPWTKKSTKRRNACFISLKEKSNFDLPMFKIKALECSQSVEWINKIQNSHSLVSVDCRPFKLGKKVSYTDFIRIRLASYSLCIIILSTLMLHDAKKH